MLFLDCEFNGHGGELISIGIAGTEFCNDFYEVLQIPQNPHEWVRTNVISKLGKDPIGRTALREKLIMFLNNALPSETLYADWPADFTHFLGLLHRDNPAYAWGTFELTMVLLPRGRYPFVAVHNAWEDAKLLRDAYVAANT